MRIFVLMTNYELRHLRDHPQPAGRPQPLRHLPRLRPRPPSLPPRHLLHITRDKGTPPAG